MAQPPKGVFCLSGLRVPTHVKPPFGLEGASGNPASPTYICLLFLGSMENIHAHLDFRGGLPKDFLRPRPAQATTHGGVT